MKKSTVSYSWFWIFVLPGISPPNKRSEQNFDAGSKYHVAANHGYIRYFAAYIYEFQFYKSLCKISGQYDSNDPEKPLHRCNFYGKFINK